MIKIKFLKAQNGDCFLISFIDQNEIQRNILVDGGKEAAFFDSSSNTYGELKVEIESLKRKKENIDLLVLTHIDNDHICGLLKWFELDGKANKIVKNVWFNSGKLIAKYLKEPENLDLTTGLKIFSSPETGVTEAIEFESYLEKKKIWIPKIILKEYEIDDFGVKMRILSPDTYQLKKLLKEYKKKTGNEAYTSSKEKDWNILLKTFIEEEAQISYKFKQDTSIKNGSSIAFILEIKGKKFLFLGDSHPTGIVNALSEMNYSSEEPLEVELLKISHHGSKGNTSKELLELVKTDNYVISTDSSGHNHPNKRTLARIINENKKAVLHFNYEYVKDNILLPQDFKDFPELKIKYTKEFNI